MKIEAGNYYKTRDDQKAYCVAVDLEVPEGFGSNSKHPCKFILQESYHITTGIDGTLYENNKAALDIVSEWTEPKQTKVFKSKKQLAKALMKGQKWKLQGKTSVCYFKEDSLIDTSNPFRYRTDDMPMIGVWSYADGETVWERV